MSVFGSEGADVVVDVDGVVAAPVAVDDSGDGLLDDVLERGGAGAALSQPVRRTAEARQARATAGARGRMIGECRSA